MKVRSRRVITVSTIIQLLFASSLQCLKAQSRKVDTLNAKQANGLVPFNKLIPDSALTSRGLFIIHQVQQKCYLEIPAQMFDKSFLMVTRISRGAADGQIKTYGHPGDLLSKVQAKFVKGPYNKVFLEGMYTYNKATDSSENGMWRVLDRSRMQPILASFDVKSSGEYGSVVVDITDFINNDNNLVTGMDGVTKGYLNISSSQPDKSYLSKVNAFPQNVEIKSVKTFIRSGMLATYEFNTSIVILPETPMRSRRADRRIGYFQIDNHHYDLNPQQVTEAAIITRWRLEPAATDVQRYLKGELVEPVKPIVFYIDPLTPKKWVPWLIRGVNDWQKAFEKAGFKNAIYAVQAPVNDSTWSLEDSRHNAIVYKPSPLMNASGPHVNDPRTGEILESHINWYHNVLALLQEWYFIQAACVDPRARQLPLNDTLMGKLIRYVCAHEVGHTLGLRHNFGASASVPVDSLRNAAWVHANGHTPSIMDYARFNYVAQPGDKIDPDDLIPRIGVYDDWAIEYGYRWLPPMSEPAEAAITQKWLAEKPARDKRLWFGDERFRSDARCQSEDLGDDPMKAGTYGIRNLKRIMDSLVEWTAPVNGDDDYEHLKKMHTALLAQYDRYLDHAADQIGGSIINFRTRSEKGNVFAFVKKAKQKEALAFLNRELFITPDWIITPKVYKLIGGYSRTSSLGQRQQPILDKLLSYRAYEISIMQEEADSANAWPYADLLDELKKYIWKDLNIRQPVDAGKRTLQKRYVQTLAGLVNPFSANPYMAFSNSSDFVSLIKGHLKELEKLTGAVKENYADRLTKLHMQDLHERLRKINKGEFQAVQETAESEGR